jgi:hypothetical protein
VAVLVVADAVLAPRLALVVGFAALAAFVQPGAARAAHCEASTPPMTYQHVVWIVFENHSRSEVIGAKDAPYFTRLSERCAAPSAYYGVTHPSIPNYLAMTGGSTFGVSSSVWPNTFRVNAPSIFDQVSWREYAGGMPLPCYLGATSSYVSLVNPAVYYTREAANCATDDVPISGDIDASARFTMIVGDMCSNMHNCTVATGDEWLHEVLPPILRSDQYAAGSTAVFVTFDENDYTAESLPTLVIAPGVTPGAAPSTRFDHYSLLRTTEEMLGVPCIAAACSATSMRSALGI